MPLRLGLDMISAFKALFSGDAGYFRAVIKAEWAFIKWWLNNRRGSKKPKSVKGKLHGYLRSNIAWAHFVRKKKYFSEIVNKTG